VPSLPRFVWLVQRKCKSFVAERHPRTKRPLRLGCAEDAPALAVDSQVTKSRLVCMAPVAFENSKHLRDPACGADHGPRKPLSLLAISA